MKLKLTDKTKTNLTRLSIFMSIFIIISIYYFSERRPFAYQGYDKNINQLQRYNAELNEAIVQTRFGLLENYEPIDDALTGLYSTMEEFTNALRLHPNDVIQKKLYELEVTLKQKEDLTYTFKQINPILINAINQFSSVLGRLIESQSATSAAEAALTQDINFQITQDVHNELMQKINDLLRRTLIYVDRPNDHLHQQIVEALSSVKKLSTDIQNNIAKYPILDFDFKQLNLGLMYLEKILVLQPEISAIDGKLFELPIVSNLNSLNDVFNFFAQNHLKRSSTYRIILYEFVLFLLIILRWAFTKLNRMVYALNIEIQRKAEAETELAEINRQLEQRVAERTRELSLINSDLNQALSDLKDTQDQLIIQEKMASVGMLTTGIAHEIKNPLNFVNNFSDISVGLLDELNEELGTSKDKLDSNALSSIEDIINDLKINCIKIKEHGVRADNIVKMMLMHSQESGVQKEIIDLENLMNDNIKIALASFKTTHEKFEPKLNKHYSLEVEKVLAAPQPIARVFIYILDNAFYAMNEKQQKSADKSYQPTLDISIQKVSSNVVVKIRDNGTGIPKKTLDKVFEPFYTTKPTGKGNTGLGLSICYDTVVKQHKGELRVQSEEGSYTEFTISLPINLKAEKKDQVKDAIVD